VPRITHSSAFLEQNGLLMILFDEAATTATSSCCGEIPGPGSLLPGLAGPGGGDTGAVLLSPCIAPGTVSSTPYNHYSMLRSVEDLFGVAHIGYAQLPGEPSFGSDVFTRRCGPPPKVVVRARVVGSRVRLRWEARGAPVAYFSLQLRRAGGRWRTLLRHTRHHAADFRGRAGRYRFRVRAFEPSGTYSRWAARLVRIRG
jgi:phosphoesterase family protein